MRKTVNTYTDLRRVNSNAYMRKSRENVIRKDVSTSIEIPSPMNPRDMKKWRTLMMAKKQLIIPRTRARCSTELEAKW